jgi:hypothetical protein
MISMPEHTSSFEITMRRIVPERLRVALDRVGERFSEEGLIRFDHRVLILLLVSATLFILLVGLRISGSSAAMWDRYIPPLAGTAKHEFRMGEAKWIRFDEWCLSTPYMLSQVARGLPRRNESIGAESSPLLMSLPVASFPSVLRPQFLLFLVSGPETAFSFYWNAKIFGLALGVFFLLMLLTGSRFWLSFTGSAWLYFSGFIQWWFSTPAPEMIATACVICICTVYILISRRPLMILTAAAVLIVALVTFALFFYPPYQLTLAYLMVFLLVGVLSEPGRRARVRELLPMRIAGAVVVLAVVAVCLAIFFGQVQKTIMLMAQTEYPGNRISAGGEYTLARYFAGFYDLLLAEKHYPTEWANVCESSGFIVLFPFVLLSYVVRRIPLREIRRIELVLMSYIALFSIWMLLDVPDVIGAITLLNRIPAKRAMIGPGFAGILLVIVHLSGTRYSQGKDRHVHALRRSRKTAKKPTPGTGTGSSLRRIGFDAAILLTAFLVLLPHGLLLKSSTQDFFGNESVVGLSAYFAIAGWSIITFRSRLFGFLILLMTVGSNLLVNPLTIGLAPIFDKDLMRLATEIRTKEPGAGWVVYGDNTLANYLIAAGVNVVNGTKFAPDLQRMAAIDISGSNRRIYNRYANIAVFPPQENDSTRADGKFTLDLEDTYHVVIDPCAARLAHLGISYYVFAFLPTNTALSCITPVMDHRVNGLWVYRRRQPGDDSTGWALSSFHRVVAPSSCRVLSIRGDAVAEEVVVTGWAIDPGQHDGAAAIYAVAGKECIAGRCGLPTPAGSPANVGGAGFEIRIPYSRIGMGTSDFTLHVLNRDRTEVRSDGRRYSVNVQ